MELEYKRGEIYYAYLTQEVGCEIFGKRPVLIISNDISNLHSPAVIVCPISTTIRRWLPTQVVLGTEIMPQECAVKCETILTIDKARLGEYVTKLDKNNMKRVHQALFESLGINQEVNKDDRKKLSVDTQKRTRSNDRDRGGKSPSTRQEQSIRSREQRKAVFHQGWRKNHRS